MLCSNKRVYHNRTNMHGGISLWPAALEAQPGPCVLHQTAPQPPPTPSRQVHKLEETFGNLPVWLAAENGVYLRGPHRSEGGTMPPVRSWLTRADGSMLSPRMATAPPPPLLLLLLLPPPLLPLLLLLPPPLLLLPPPLLLLLLWDPHPVVTQCQQPWAPPPPSDRPAGVGVPV